MLVRLGLYQPGARVAVLRRILVTDDNPLREPSATTFQAHCKNDHGNAVRNHLAPFVGIWRGRSWAGALASDFCRADFVGGRMRAGPFEGAPHVPAGDGAVGAPSFAEGEEFFGLRHVLFAVGDGPAFFHARGRGWVGRRGGRDGRSETFRPSRRRCRGPRRGARRVLRRTVASPVREWGRRRRWFLRPRSFMARILAPDRPALRRPVCGA